MVERSMDDLLPCSLQPCESSVSLKENSGKKQCRKCNLSSTVAAFRILIKCYEVSNSNRLSTNLSENFAS